MVGSPVLLVENRWHERSADIKIGELLGVTITSCATYEELADLIKRVAGDPDAREPVVLLDAGLDMLCRLATCHRAVNEFPRARFILWTADRTVTTHAGALIDGAFAALPKTASLETIVRVIERVGTGRRWCEPDQAQFLADLLLCMSLQRNGEPGRIWQATELEGMASTEAERAMLLEIAKGEPMPVADDWFVRMLALLRPRWLPPYLRRALMALALFPTRREAAVELGIAIGTINGNASSLSGRLLPHRHISTDIDRQRDHEFVRVLAQMHDGCELPREAHDFSPEAFGMRG